MCAVPLQVSAELQKREEDSLENFYINRFGKVLYSMFFEGYTEKLWGRHPREIVADWGSQRVKGLSILGILKDMLSKAVATILVLIWNYLARKIFLYQ